MKYFFLIMNNYSLAQNPPTKFATPPPINSKHSPYSIDGWDFFKFTPMNGVRMETRVKKMG